MTIMEATRAARKATGRNVGTRVEQGKWQVVEVVYRPRKSSLVNPLSPWGTGAEALRDLNAFAERGLQ